MNQCLIFSGSASRKLSEKIAAYLGKTLGQIEISRFSDGEISVQIKENVR
ncbi:MAG TPA: ribose-phosphate pyrophosphokinase-like domain-containing protein, partial [bacterium]|nr:ribose-phosphate pyrophosphokinase-like domain-containing protein [bacterium]